MSDIQLVLRSIQKDLTLPRTEINSSDLDMEALQSYLMQVIKELLDKDFNRLLHAMYRIDIPEKDFLAVLNTTIPDEIPKEIANLVIDREMQKVASRNKYS